LSLDKKIQKSKLKDPLLNPDVSDDNNAGGARKSFSRGDRYDDDAEKEDESQRVFTSNVRQSLKNE